MEGARAVKASCSPTPRAAVKKARAKMDVTTGAAAESEMASMEAEASGDDESGEKKKRKG